MVLSVRGILLKVLNVANNALQVYVVRNVFQDAYFYLDSTTPLGAGATFTGTRRYATQLRIFRVAAYADQKGRIHIEESDTDDFSARIHRSTTSYTTVNEVAEVEKKLEAQYVRVLFENDSGFAQTVFWLRSSLQNC